jgi:hypothetical protein
MRSSRFHRPHLTKLNECSGASLTYHRSCSRASSHTRSWPLTSASPPPTSTTCSDVRRRSGCPRARLGRYPVGNLELQVLLRARNLVRPISTGSGGGRAVDALMSMSCRRRFRLRMVVSLIGISDDTVVNDGRSRYRIKLTLESSVYRETLRARGELLQLPRLVPELPPRLSK